MIDKIREYLFNQNIIDADSRICVDFLGNEPTDFAIMPMPTDPILEEYITGEKLYQFQFNLMGIMEFGEDTIKNIENSTFFENLYNTITNLNKQGTLPNIDGIQSIECLNNGTIEETGLTTARYSIQLRITYKK